MNAVNAHRTRASLTIVTSLFFIFGFLTCMNDILVPHLKSLFTLTYAQASLVQFCFFFAYFVMSIPSARFCDRHGYKTGMLTGLLGTAAGALGLFGSATFLSFELFLGSFFVLASGITLLQVAVNPYVTLLGTPDKASSRLNLVQAFNSLGTFLAPHIGAAFILSSTGSDSVQGLYLLFAGILVALMFALSRFQLPSFHAEAETKESYWSVLTSNPRLLFACIAIFLYVGAEVSIGSFLINWLQEPSVTGLTASVAGSYLAYYWGGAMVGRFLSTPLLEKYAPPKVLAIFTLCAASMTLISSLTTGQLSQWSILCVGLFNSIMFPTIFSLGVEGLGRQTAKGSGLLCTAIVGGAILPLLQGLLADHIGLRGSFALAFVCYLGLFAFARKVSSLKNGEARLPIDTASHATPRVPASI